MNQLTSVDRQGYRLSSASDIQIVWEAVKLGFSAGVSPTLRLTHLIQKERSHLSYVKRLAFGTASSYIPALVESFPLAKDKVLKIPSRPKLILELGKRIPRKLFNPRLIGVEVAGYLGHTIGTLKASRSSQHQWIYHWVKWLNLE